MATEVEQLYLQLELINTEEQMLLLQMLKRRRQRRRLRRLSVRPLNRSRLGTGEFTTQVHPLRNLDEQMHFRYFRMSMGRFDELLHCVQPLKPEKATVGNYILRGPITALVRIFGARQATSSK